MGRKQDPAIIEDVLLLGNEAKSTAKANESFWPVIAKKIREKHGIPFTAERARGMYRRAKSRIKPPDPNSKIFIERASDIIFHDKVKPKDISMEDMIGGFISAQDFRRDFNVAQIQADFEIKTDKPIAVSWLTDWHLGSPNTNYKAIQADTKQIRDNPRMYVCLGGDSCDNFMPGFRDSRAVTGQLHPARVQLLAEEKLIEYLAGKIVAKNGGNHDAMPSKKTGIDAEYFILRDKPFPVMPFGGLLKLIVGEVEYKILWKHKYRYNSTLNLFNSHRQLLQNLEPTADIVVKEHEHNPGIEVIEKFEFDSRKTVVNIRTGTYKIDDPYSLEYFKSGRMGPQTVVLFPDRRKIVPFHGEDALDDTERFFNGTP